MIEQGARSLETLRGDVNSSLSGMESQWADALRKRRETNEMTNGMQQYEEMAQLSDRERYRQLQRRDNQNATMASAMAHALMSDGGRLNPYDVGYVNRRMQDGSTTGNIVRDVGYYNDGSGDFGMVVEIPGKNGQKSQFREHRITPRDQLAMAVNYPGMFGDGRLETLRGRLRSGKQPLTDREIADIESLGMAEYRRDADELEALKKNVILFGKNNRDSRLGRSVEDQILIDNNRNENRREASELRHREHLDRIWQNENKRLSGERMMWELNPNNKGKDYDKEVVEPAKRNIYGEYYPAKKESGGDVPRVYKNRLDIPGMDSTVAPNEVFEINGRKWTWDGSSDGDLKKHIHPAK